MSRKVLIIFCVIMIAVIALVIGLSIYFQFTVGKDNNNEGYYVFCYFTGNEPEQERVSFAVSSNGYEFTLINKGIPMIKQTLGTGCCRDPYIFKANNKYYIIATDMKSKDGWDSNHSMIIFESSDLINWGNERIIDVKVKPGFEETCRTWAPQVIYDEAAGKYMVYWSHCLRTDWKNYIVYAYLNDDFTDIGDINILYKPENGKDVIDADIISEGGKYYLYYKDEKESIICYAYSDSLLGPYKDPENPKVSKSRKDVEGSCMYKLTGTDTYLMIMDEYDSHHYYMQATTSSSMTEFKPVRIFDYSFKFKPRHGSILAIDKNEYEALVSVNK